MRIFTIMSTKNFFLCLAALLCFLHIGQTQATAQNPDEATLVYNWQDSTLIPSIYFGNRYNEVWGFVRNGREYAVMGSERGTHIFDLSNRSNIHESHFVPAPFTGEYVVHRDYHDYNGYLYIVCDEGGGISTLQIVALHDLPNSVQMVYDSNDLFDRSHNIFIDTATAKMYACIPKHTDGTKNGLEVYSLQSPEQPQLIGVYDNVDVHDLYVRNDTAYLNAGNDGLWVLDFADAANPVLLGSLTQYVTHGQGYNHSGWLSDDGQYYVFADETHGIQMKVCDVSDLSDINVVSTFWSDVDVESIAHNLIIRDDFVYVAHYHDGLQIFDISDPYNPTLAAEYDTYSPTDHYDYRGAWGVYPFLPSGLILVSDMQYGLYVLDVGLEPEDPLVVAEKPNSSGHVSIYPTATK